MNMLRHLPTKRVVAAAVRLAAVYALGVSTLLIVLLISTDETRAILADLPVVSIPASICFAIAFLILGVARRAGFTTLWLLIFGLWAWQLLMVYRGYVGRPQVEFVMWSILAAPLYAMVSIGFPPATPARPTRWRRLRNWSLVATWAALTALAVSFEPYSPFARHPWPLWMVLQLAWLAIPPALTLDAIFRVYKGVLAEPAVA